MQNAKDVWKETSWVAIGVARNGRVLGEKRGKVDCSKLLTLRAGQCEMTVDDIGCKESTAMMAKMYAVVGRVTAGKKLGAIGITQQEVLVSRGF